MTASIELNFNTEDKSIIKLCEQYWALDEDGSFTYSVSAIAREADLKSHELNKLIYANCDAFTLDDICASCGGSRIYSNRSDFTQCRRLFDLGHEWTCADCKAEEQELAAAAKREQDEQRRTLVKEHYAVKPHEFDLEDLTLRDAVFLITLIRHLATEDFKSILSLQSNEEPLTPSRDYDAEVVKHLYKRNLIAVDPGSSIDAFAFNEENVPDRFYLTKVRWVLITNNESVETNIAFIREVERMFREMDWNPDWEDEVVDLWREVALHECLSYLKLALEDHKLPFTPGEKTVQMFNEVLENYSVSQIYSFIWRAAKDAAAFYAREKVAKTHAANTVVGAIQRAAERAYANGWDIKHYGRDRRLPESVLNQVLFNRALQIGDEGFKAVPYWNWGTPVADEDMEEGPPTEIDTEQTTTK
jgi:hypothetical protein